MRPPPPDPTATPYPTPTLEPSPPAWPNYPPPVSGQFNPSPGPLGNPTELTATAGNYAPGHVSLQWKPAANASVHWAYVVKVDGSDGGYWEEFRTYNGRFYSPEYLSLNFVLPEIGQEYWFAVIGVQENENSAETGTAIRSEWTNWARLMLPANPGQIEDAPGGDPPVPPPP